MTAQKIKIRVARIARIEIAEQSAYYREKAGEELSNRWRTSVNRAIQSLRILPERGAPAKASLPELAGLRMLHLEGFPKHLVFYVYDGNIPQVDILSVVHGARDLSALLRDPSE
ncbi:Plasmid stabilization system protein ParE [Bryocella elongata]|uniref:Plasmid stabilization system protein ParE n=1 Tax=Bryocella elongata TaxID=863522 RepID=A0A1H6C2F4_9BACT|nr:type II toxin-antitoxin system RelE/ParE family toxin [Bryocella elongata]SEG66546.1 Plasmid stabilization system protein ParE [Bryocella elongata]